MDKIRDARRAYFGACSYIDSNVGKLLQTLEDTGLADDTLIVFSGDHGDMLGERGLWYKMHWFEMAARVPLLISAPGQFAAGRCNASGLHRRPVADPGGTGRRSNWNRTCHWTAARWSRTCKGRAGTTKCSANTWPKAPSAR